MKKNSTAPAPAPAPADPAPADPENVTTDTTDTNGPFRFYRARGPSNEQGGYDVELWTKDGDTENYWTPNLRRDGYVKAGPRS